MPRVKGEREQSGCSSRKPVVLLGAGTRYRMVNQYTVVSLRVQESAEGGEQGTVVQNKQGMCTENGMVGKPDTQAAN